MDPQLGRAEVDLVKTHQSVGAPDRLVVCWSYPDGRVGRGSPLPADVAREIALVYTRQYPERHYWTEPAQP